MTSHSWQAWIVTAGLVASQSCQQIKRLAVMEIAALSSPSLQQRMKIPSTSASAEEFLVWSWLLMRALFMFGSKHTRKLLLALCIMESRPFDQSFPASKCKSGVVMFHLCTMAKPKYIMLFLLPLQVSETQEHGLERGALTGSEWYGFIVGRSSHSLQI